MYAALEFFFVIILILVNGVLSMSEMAVVASRRPRLQQLADQGDESAQMALELTDEPGSFLSTVQIGITLVGILIGALGGAAVARIFARWISDVAILAPYADAVSVSFVVVLLTYLTLVLGELAPKQIALQNSERIAMRIAKPMLLLARITAPFVVILSYSTKFVLRLMRQEVASEPSVSEDEVRMMIEQGANLGVFEPMEEEIVGQVFRLADLQVGDLITPRTEIRWIDEEDSIEDIRKTIIDSGRSRLPVARGNMDQVMGIVLAKDLLAQCMTGEELDLDSILQPAIFVPENTQALLVIEQFKETHSKIALVIDEYGGLEGLVTVDDLLQALLGAIPEPEEPPMEAVTQRSDGSWLVDGLLLLEDLEEQFGIPELPESLIGYRTVGGLMMGLVGRLPVAGDRVSWADYDFEVVDMDGRRVDKVIIAQSENDEENDERYKPSDHFDEARYCKFRQIPLGKWLDALVRLRGIPA